MSTQWTLEYGALTPASAHGTLWCPSTMSAPRRRRNTSSCASQKLFCCYLGRPCTWLCCIGRRHWVVLCTRRLKAHGLPAAANTRRSGTFGHWMWGSLHDPPRKNGDMSVVAQREYIVALAERWWSGTHASWKVPTTFVRLYRRGPSSNPRMFRYWCTISNATPGKMCVWQTPSASSLRDGRPCSSKTDSCRTSTLVGFRSRSWLQSWRHSCVLIGDVHRDTLCGNTGGHKKLTRATSHTRLRARDHDTSSPLIGRKGGSRSKVTLQYA